MPQEQISFVIFHWICSYETHRYFFVKTVGTMKLDRLLGFVVFARVLGCREPDISAGHGACFQNFIVITVSIWDQLFFGMFVANNLYPQHDLDFKRIHD